MAYVVKNDYIVAGIYATREEAQNVCDKKNWILELGDCNPNYRVEETLTKRLTMQSSCDTIKVQ